MSFSPQERALGNGSENSRIELTPLLVEVLEPWSQGHSNREIATGLGLPESTVWARINRLYSLFGINGYSLDGRFQLLRKVIEFGYLPPDTDLSPFKPPEIPFASEKLRESQLLTYREKQTVVLVVLGKTNKGIAKELRISPETVKNHVSAIFGKLDTHERTELMIKAISEGWVDIPSLKERFAGQITQLETLSLREMEALGKVAQGLFNKEIAQSLEILDPTVRNHVNNVLRKLGAKTRTEAALVYLLGSK